MAELSSTEGRAEKYVWENLRRQLERQGQGEAAGQLQHHLRTSLDRVEDSADGLRTYRFHMQHRVSDHGVKLNANDGSLMGWQYSLLGEDSQGDVSSEQALTVAREVAQPPAGAVLKTAEFEAAGDMRVFVARWVHEENGIPVERDYIQVLVNSKTARVFFLARRWHQVDPEFTTR